MLSTGQKTVTTAGTRVALGTGVVNSKLLIRAAASNTGLIYLGDSTVSSTTGYILEAGAAVFIGMAGDLSKIFIDSSVNSQKVSYIALDSI
jgi:hypothetical protein